MAPEEDALCPPSDLGKEEQGDVAGHHSPVKKLKPDVGSDPSLTRSKYSLRARIKPPERWSKLGSSYSEGGMMSLCGHAM